MSQLPMPAIASPVSRRPIAIQTLSTRGMLPKPGIEYWNEVACSTFTQQCIDPLERPFSAEMYRANLGDMRVAVAVSTASIVTRSRYQVSRSPEAYFMLHLQLAGTSCNRQDGREVELERGDFALFDSTRPYQVEFKDDTSILVLRIPHPVFRRVVARPEAITLLRMSGNKGPARLASRFIQDLWGELRQGIPWESAGHLCRPILDVIAAAYAAVPAAHVERSAVPGALRLELVRFIEEHLGEETLSVSAIAAAFGITSRYVHSLFKDRPDTVSDYIRTRRLEEAAKGLKDPLRSSLHIGAIAIAHGFKSQAHFSRLFRARYGLTPREFRRGWCG